MQKFVVSDYWYSLYFERDSSGWLLRSYWFVSVGVGY